MKMTGLGMKGATAIFIGWLTYINHTFTPLFWVLLALVALDLMLNVHKEGQQFYKIGSMAISLGVPSYVASNLDNPNLGKYLVALMCLVYLQIVVPSLIHRMESLKLSKDPKQNAIDQAAIEALIKKVAALEQEKAQEVVDSTKQDGGQGGV